MFAYILCTNDKLYVCKLHSNFCKGMRKACNNAIANLISLQRKATMGSTAV